MYELTRGSMGGKVESKYEKQGKVFKIDFKVLEMIWGLQRYALWTKKRRIRQAYGGEMKEA